MEGVPLFPEEASTIAAQVDGLFFFLVIVTGLVAMGVIVTILVFVARYRRRSELDRTPRITGSLPLELFWSTAPFIIFMGMFIWGASVYNSVAHPPADADEVYVVGKQWMWKLQHSGGQREINELHLPVNRPVKLILTSEDVIHDFFVPVFRTKVDVIPGRYVYIWYQPTKTGKFHLFCSQYCGTDHAGMVGWVYVMEEDKYEEWLRGESKAAGNENAVDGSLAARGRQLFLKLECITCHTGTVEAHCPTLEGLYGSSVRLRGGRRVLADEAYIRESILDPRAKIVEGWEPIMPTFKGQVSEEELIDLIAFIKSLRPGATPTRNEETPAPIGAPTTAEERAKRANEKGKPGAPERKEKKK